MLGFGALDETVRKRSPSGLSMNRIRAARSDPVFDQTADSLAVNQTWR